MPTGTQKNQATQVRSNRAKLANDFEARITAPTKTSCFGNSSGVFSAYTKAIYVSKEMIKWNMRTRTKLERMFTEFARRLFAVLQPLQKTILMNIADTPFTQAGIEQRLLGCRPTPTYTTQILLLLFFLQKMFFCS